MQNEKIKIITHSDSFHIDELLAVAALDLLLDGKYTLIRTRDPEIIKTGDYVVDVGGEYIPEENKFDHHQKEGAGLRKEGIPYSSFGLVWKKFGAQICGRKDTADIIDKKIVVYIDAEDNGIDTYEVKSDLNIYSLPKAIKIFRPIFEEERTFDEGFEEALKFIKRILEREILKAGKYIITKKFAEEAYNNASDKRIIVLDKYIPAIDSLRLYPEPLFIVVPRTKKGEWMVQAIVKNKNSFSAKKAFPKSWKGKQGEEIVDATGVPDAKFCHHSGEYLCIAGSKEGALALARLAVEA